MSSINGDKIKKTENDILETTLSIAEKGYPEAYQFLLDEYERNVEKFGPQTLYFLVCLAGGADMPEQASVSCGGDTAMSKRVRQYIGILTAVAAYYFIHEGAHLLYALFVGAFKQIHFMGLGVQIDVYAEQMTDGQLGIFCIAGALATFCAGCLLTLAARKICHAKSRLFRAILYYITIAFLLIDPLYLSLLCGFFGGGDMNGISLLCPEWLARCLFGMVLIGNGLVFWKRVLPNYRKSFEDRI